MFNENKKQNNCVGSMTIRWWQRKLNFQIVINFNLLDVNRDGPFLLQVPWKCQEAFESFQRSTKYPVRNSSMVDRIHWSRKCFSIHQERGSEHVLVSTQSHRCHGYISSPCLAQPLCFIQSIEMHSDQRHEETGAEERSNVEEERLMAVPLEVLRPQIA